MKGVCLPAVISFCFCLFFIETAFAQNTMVKISTAGWAEMMGVRDQQAVEIDVPLSRGRPDISSVVAHVEMLLDRSDYESKRAINYILSHLHHTLWDQLCRDSNSCKRGLEDGILEAKARFLDKRTYTPRVFYPDWFYLDTSNCNPQVAFQEVDQVSRQCIGWKGNQPYCNILEDSCLIRVLLSSSHSRIISTNDTMMNKIKSLSPMCQRQIYNHISGKIGFVSAATMSRCVRNENKNEQSICHVLKQHLNFLGRTWLRPLNDLVYNHRGNSNECSSYQRGEVRVVTGDRHQNYLVKRNSDGSYTIPLAMEFKATDDYDNSRWVPREAVPSYYFRKVRNCINDFNPALLGPNGERLNIEIKDYYGDSRCIPRHSISIQSSRSRSNAESYEADIDCPAIIHEVLHLLGLNDEYTETIIKADDFLDDDLPLAYQCRVVQEDSIMANHWERLCNVKTIAMQEKTCEGYTTCIESKLFGSIRRPTNSCHDSLLDPAHFNAILYGDCSQRRDVALFRECSGLAYRNPVEPLRSIWCPNCHDEMNETHCLDKKKECESQDVLNRSANATVRGDGNTRSGRGIE